MNDDRLINLETKIAHLEFTLEQTETALFEQNQKLAQLEKVVKWLKDRLDEGGAGNQVPPNEKPPHY